MFIYNIISNIALMTVVSLANQISWTIELTRIVIRLFFRMLYQRTKHSWHHFYSFGNKFVLKIQPSVWEIYWILYHKTNIETLTGLCSVVKHYLSAKVSYKPLNVLCMCFPRPNNNPSALQCRGVVTRLAILIATSCTMDRQSEPWKEG